jgi:membrane protease YdiL (CAAX protease family)
LYNDNAFSSKNPIQDSYRDYEEEHDMSKLKSLATNRPIVFGVIITVSFSILLILISIPVMILGELGENAKLALLSFERLVITALFVFLLNRFGWLHPAGFRRPDRPRRWAVIVLPSLFLCLTLPYAYTRSLTFDLSDPAKVAVTFLNALAIGLVEETIFRGVILYAFLRLWGDSQRGLARTMVVSSLLFGAIHLVNLLAGAPVEDVLSQTIFTTFLGFFLAAVVLYARSIWPAIVVHGLIDVVTHLNVIGKPNLDAVSTDLLLWAAIIVPVGFYGLYLLRRVEQKLVIPDTP